MGRWLSIAMLLAALSVLPLRADEGRIPIYRSGTITAPGAYVLTRDISVTGGNAITIQASGVTLDLNGRAVSSSSSSGNLIQINDGAIDVTILNGRLYGGNNGINYVTSNSNAMGPRIKGVDIQHLAGDGIYIAGAAYIEISNCRIEWATRNGIYVSGAAANWFTRNARIVDNDIISPGWNGIVLHQLQGGEVAGNMVTDHSWNMGNGSPGTGGVGILLSANYESGGNLLERNVISWARKPEAEGIRIEPLVHNNLVRANVAKNPGLWGVSVRSDNNRIVDNLIGAISSDGIRVEGSRNLIDHNTVGPGGLCGINFINGNFHAYRDNFVRTGGPPLCGSSNTDGGGNIF